MTSSDAETYLPDVTEEVTDVVNLVTLSISQFCFVLNVVDDQDNNQLGRKELRKGVRKRNSQNIPIPFSETLIPPLNLLTETFFLHPGESLENGVEKAYLLAENEGVMLRSLTNFTDLQDPAYPRGKDRIPGEIWMVFGMFLFSFFLFFFLFLFLFLKPRNCFAFRSHTLHSHYGARGH